MEERDKPILMSPEGTVAFCGYATISLQDDEIENHTILDDDDDTPSNSNNQEKIENFDSLEALRAVEYSKLHDSPLVFEVLRSNVYNALLDIYKKRGIVSHKVILSFSHEPAGGDGVTKDCYAEFFDKLYEKMEGTVEKVPIEDLDEEELEVIGRIINHAFLQFSVFPLQLSKTTLMNILFNDIGDKELLSSFFNFITPMEAEIISQYTKGKESNCQALIDILHGCKVFDKPTPQNAMELCLKAANIVLVKRPFWSMQCIVKGMGGFWNKLDPTMIDALYSTCTPNSESLIEKIIPNETCAQDQAVTTYLHRYIRSCTQSELQLLVRFITGSSSISPESVIKLEFVDQPPEHLHPLTQTCFKILILPRQFRSFTQFQSIVNVHLSSQEHWSVYDTFTDF